MANRERGEVSVDIDGTSYTLCLDLNAMCQLEEMFSKPGQDVTFQDVLRKVKGQSLRHTRAVFWAALQKHHKEITLDAVADFIIRAGGISAFSDQLLMQLGMAVQATTPDAEDVTAMGIDGKKKAPKGRIRSVRGGTGGRSTSKRAR